MAMLGAYCSLCCVQPCTKDVTFNGGGRGPVFKYDSFPSSAEVIQITFRHTFVEEKVPGFPTLDSYRVKVSALKDGLIRPFPRRLMYDSGDVQVGDRLNVCRVKLEEENLIEIEVTQNTSSPTWEVKVFCSECSPPNPLP